MSKDWKKFGSPYDPSHSGKMQKPKTAEEKRREEEQEQHMLRGCGDPSCGQCNPETAASFRGGTVTGRFSSPSFSSSMMEEILRSARGHWLRAAPTRVPGGLRVCRGPRHCGAWGGAASAAPK